MQDLTENRKFEINSTGNGGGKKMLPKLGKEGGEVSCYLLAWMGLHLHMSMNAA